jgi:hypothetical protein
MPKRWGKRTANLTDDRLEELLEFRMPDFKVLAHRWDCSARYLEHVWHRETRRLHKRESPRKNSLAILRRKP